MGIKRDQLPNSILGLKGELPALGTYEDNKPEDALGSNIADATPPAARD
tara:strand:+ start:27280 stop:27426 length:147 start_codon:yes stop_codon:yes gene_type:complete